MDDLKEYLGDGVYAQWHRGDGSVVLTTSTHVVSESDNVVYVNVDTAKALVRFLRRLQATGVDVGLGS